MTVQMEDVQIAIVQTLVRHRDLTAPAVHAFVALYAEPGTNYTRTKLGKLLGYHRNTMTSAIKLLESKGLVKCPKDVIQLVNIIKDI